MNQDARLARVLDDEQQRADARVRKFEDELDALTRARRSESDDDEHDPEGVPLSAEWSRITGLLESARSNAAQVEAAKERLADGSYGVCLSCGQPIPVERLEVRPFADRCVPCAS
ncbi:MAG: molecular chaperone DnaK [Microbacteriaceae bacterium]|nr:molecular chaperone DnaK [Microbacteriaceae bacterium]